MKRILLILLLLPLAALAQTNFTLNDASTYPSARAGINLGLQTYYDSYLLKNLISINAGMQPSQQTAVVTVSGTGTTTSFTDYNPYNGWTSGLFAGGTGKYECQGGQYSGAIQICTGNGDAGHTFTISSNTASTGSVGATFTITPALPAAPSSNDTIYIYGPRVCGTNGGFDFNHFGWNQSGATIDCASGDFPAGFTGVQVIDIPSGANVSSGFDTGNGNYYFSGGYTQCGLARIKTTGTSTLTMSAARVSGGSTFGHWTGNVTISGTTWTPYCITPTASGAESAGNNPFTAPGSTPNPMVFTWANSGAEILFIQPVIAPTTDYAAPTQYLGSTIADISAIDPGECRYWAGQNGETIDNWIAPQWMRFTSSVSYNATAETANGGMQQGLIDFGNGAAAMGCESVEVVIPITTDPSSVTNYIDCLAGSSGTTYGTKCIADGRPSGGWQTMFKRVLLEYGNEVWNPGAGNEAMIGYSIGPTPAWNYAPLLIQFCSDAKADANWPSNFRCVGTVQTGNPGGSPGFIAQQDTGKKVDLYANNEYTAFTPTVCTVPSIYQSAWTEVWANVHDPSSQSGFYQSNTCTGCANSDVYEYNNSTNSGSCSQAQLNPYPETMGYALANAETSLLDNLAFGIVDTNLFTLYQQTVGIGTSGGASSIHDWGGLTGPGGQYHNQRPMLTAIKLENVCASTGDTGFSVTGSSVPTYNFSGYNGVNSQSNVPLLRLYGRETGSQRCVIAYNYDSTSHAVTFSGTNPPSSPTITTMFSANLTDNNETANSSPVVTTHAGSATLPAYSVSTFVWSTSGPPPATGYTISGPVGVSGTLTVTP